MTLITICSASLCPDFSVVSLRWPTFALTPAEYEQSAGHQVTNWQVQHLDPVEGVDGTYVIDVTVRFRLLGADF